MLALPLPDYAIHMTLHDMVSPETYRADSAEEYGQAVTQSINSTVGIMEDIRKEFAGRKITMVADRMVNMAPTGSCGLVLPRSPYLLCSVIQE